MPSFANVSGAILRDFLNFKNNYKFVVLFLFCLMSCLSFGFPFKPLHVITLFLIMLTVSNLSSILYKVLVVIICLLSAAYIPVALTYGAVDFNSMLSVKYSNLSEGVSFIKTIPWFYYLFTLLMLGIATAVFTIKVDNLKYRKIIITYVLISVASTPIRLYINDGVVKLTSSGIPPLRFVNDAIAFNDQVDVENAIMQQSLTTPDVWTPEVIKEPKYQNYIIVIGESVRSDYLQSYGFPAMNTPYMSKAPGILFTHYISAASSTQTSLKNSLSLRRGNHVELNNNIITLANKAGFTTYWYSNQGSLGRHDTSVASFARRASDFDFKQTGESSDIRGFSDENLLENFGSAIKQKKPIKLIVLHLMGSHPEACDRTQGKYTEFRQSREISCYIESIRNTDKLLANVAGLANESGQSWTMMYFADHGLSFKDADTDYARLQHGDIFKQNYSVPMFITASDSQNKKIFNAPRSAINFLTLFTQWTNIKEPLIDTRCNMLLDVPCDNQDSVIQFNQQKVAFSTLQEDTVAH